MKKEEMNMMAEALENTLKEHGYDKTVTVEKVWKNNESLYGLCVKGDEDTIAPTIYPRDNDTVNDILDRVINVFENGISTTEFNVETLLSADYMTKNVFSKVVQFSVENLEGIKSKNLVHVIHDDLELIELFAVRLEMEDGSIGSSNVSEDLLKRVGISKDLLKEHAHINMTHEVEICSMFDILKSMMSNIGDIEDLMPEDEPSMLVISNKSKNNGAAMLFLDDLYERLHKIKPSRSYVILPSSIHELIAVPGPVTGDSIDEFNRMVYEVNSTQVDIQDKLIDGVYMINKDSGLKKVA